MFVFDKDYNNREQVRPYMDGYKAVRAELEAAGQYPYNSSFKGRIPGIEGPSEDTAIYMLQTLYDVDALNERVAAFLEDGGERIESAEGVSVRRGTVVHYGFYMGGTGWTQYDSARLITHGGTLAVLPKRKRSNGYRLHANVLFRAE